MRSRFRPLALLALATFAASCGEQTPTGPAVRPVFSHAANHPAVRFSEIHYDNASTDIGEAIEISGPAGTDLTNWSIVLYNGNPTQRNTYGTRVLSGAIGATCGARGVMVATYPSNGIQNGGAGAAGEPDGFALVNASGVVVEFLSYEGSFVAANGPAVGMTSSAIGAFEAGSEPAGLSLARDASGAWSGPAANTFGTCNDDDTPPPPAVVADVVVTPPSATIVVGATQAFTAAAFDASNAALTGVAFTWTSTNSAVATVSGAGVATGVAAGTAQIIAAAPNGVADTSDLQVDAPPPPPLPATRFAELHYDNFGTDAGETIEIEGEAGTSLAGWSVVLYNGNGGGAYNTTLLSGTIPSQCDGPNGRRGVVTVVYGTDGIQNGAPDGMALIDNTGAVVEFLSYEGTMTATGGPALGRTSVDIGVAQASTPVGQTLQRRVDGTWTGPVASTLGSCNIGGDPPPPPPHTFTFFGRSPTSDPPLPVGFQAQIFVTVLDGSGTVVTGNVWSSDTPLIASIDQNGVITALDAGTATFRATTPDGLNAGTYSLPMRIGAAGGTAQYGHNTEFGEPADADASDDFLIRRDQFTSSFSSVRNTPNWVAYNIDATHFGAEDRCNCFTHDPLLPASFPVLTTADYTGAGAFAGYGIDRGHMARSFDRTTGSLDNATTYYFSNIIPQTNALNTGLWAQMENDLGDSARVGNREVFIITGPAGNAGTVKGLGLITIPTRVWKVVLILPRDRGLADVDSWDDVTVIAVDMPNIPAPIPDPDPSDPLTWHDFRTTVDAVEALSGYDVFALLPDQVEIAVESNTRPPTAALDGPYAGAEGSAVAMSGAGSTDPDAGDALSHAWTFGDGGTATGATVSHVYAQNGVYTVTLTVTDSRGLVSTATTTASVANVAPALAPIAGAVLLPGETYAAGGSFTDPGADSWTASVNYGDGSPTAALPLSGMTFTLGHTYTAPGSYTVTVTVGDGDATSSTTATVTVWTAAQGIQAAAALTSDAWIVNKLRVAEQQLGRGNVGPALNQLEEIVRELDRRGGGDPALRGLIERLMVLLAD